MVHRGLSSSWLLHNICWQLLTTLHCVTSSTQWQKPEILMGAQNLKWSDTALAMLTAPDVNAAQMDELMQAGDPTLRWPWFQNSKWKQLFVNACRFKTPICTSRGILSSKQSNDKCTHMLKDYFQNTTASAIWRSCTEFKDFHSIFMTLWTLRTEQPTACGDRDYICQFYWAGGITVACA